MMNIQTTATRHIWPGESKRGPLGDPDHPHHILRRVPSRLYMYSTSVPEHTGDPWNLFSQNHSPKNQKS